MKTVIHRKADGVTGEAVVNQFRSTLDTKSSQYGEQSDIEKLVALYAKTPTDNFIVSDSEDLRKPLKQGDINFYHESSDYYKKVIDTVKNLKSSSNMNLQEGVSVTGDHRIVPIAGAKMTIQDGQFHPADDIMNSRPYECKIVKSDKPFLVTHREHGNIAMQAGTYLVFTQIQPETMRRVLD